MLRMNILNKWNARHLTILLAPANVASSQSECFTASESLASRLLLKEIAAISVPAAQIQGHVLALRRCAAPR